MFIICAVNVSFLWACNDGGTRDITLVPLHVARVQIFRRWFRRNLLFCQITKADQWNFVWLCNDYFWHIRLSGSVLGVFSACFQIPRSFTECHTYCTWHSSWNCWKHFITKYLLQKFKGNNPYNLNYDWIYKIISCGFPITYWLLFPTLLVEIPKIWGFRANQNNTNW